MPLILAAFDQTYPDAHIELMFTTPLELLVATILSAQCTDKRVNEVTASLFQRYKTAADYVAAPPAQLEEDIRSTGFFRNKAKNIRECCRTITDTFGGAVPKTMEELLTLPGVGRKTANVVLGDAFGVPGIVVDTHVQRLSKRLGLSQEKSPDAIEQELMLLVPQASWTKFSHQMIWHGRRLCNARKPRCEICPLADACPAAAR